MAVYFKLTLTHMLSIPLNKPLTKTALEKLGKFLEKHDLPHLLTINGFLTAIVSGPNMIMPSVWMDFLGLNNGNYESMDEAQETIGCIMAMYNDIAHQLQDQTFRIINPYLKNKYKSNVSTAKNLWAKGYVLGVGYDKDVWLANDEVLTLLFPILSLRMDDEILQQLIHTKIVNLKPSQEYSEDQMSEAANAVYKYWLKQRNPAADITRIQAKKSQAGRNEPCPCGSGKKFKKCCLH